MKHIILSLLLTGSLFAQNLSNTPVITGPNVDPALDKVMFFDASTGQMARTNFAELVNVPSLFTTGNFLAAGSVEFAQVSGLQTALDAKSANAANLSDLANAVTARGNLGLGSVDNTSDASKPVSSLTQTAINARQLLMSGVIVTKANGTRTAYPPSAGTNDLAGDTARGLALEAAFAAAAAGDTLDLSPGNYLVAKATSNVAGIPAQFNILNGMKIRLNGARLYKTAANENPTVNDGSFVVGSYYRTSVTGTSAWANVGGNGNNFFFATATGTGAGGTSGGTGVAIKAGSAMFATASTGVHDWSITGPGIIEGTVSQSIGVNGVTYDSSQFGLNYASSHRVNVTGVIFRYFPGAGVQFTNASYTDTGTTLNSNLKLQTGTWVNCGFDYNNLGIANYQGAEYHKFINCHFNNNLTGADIRAGNCHFTNCEVSGNTNDGLFIRDGANEGHGCFIGGAITHNVGFAIRADYGMDLGFIFNGVSIGGDNATSNKIQSHGSGLNFVGCYIDAPFYASQTPSGINTVSHCYFLNGTVTPPTMFGGGNWNAEKRRMWRFLDNNNNGQSSSINEQPVAAITTLTAAKTLGAITSASDAFVNCVSGTYAVTLPSATGSFSMTVTAGSSATDFITCPIGGNASTQMTIQDHTPWVFTSLTGGAGLATGVVYWVVSATAGSWNAGVYYPTFKLAATEGGAVIDITTDITAATMVRADARGSQYTIKNSGTGIISLNTTASQTIDGSASGVIMLAQWAKVSVVSDGVNWITK